MLRRVAVMSNEIYFRRAGHTCQGRTVNNGVKHQCSLLSDQMRRAFSISRYLRTSLVSRLALSSRTRDAGDDRKWLLYADVIAILSALLGGRVTTPLAVHANNAYQAVYLRGSA